MARRLQTIRKFRNALNVKFPLHILTPPQRRTVWERGLNENTNGLLRQYIPKKVPLLVLTPQRLGQIQNLINHRPRQTLGFLTPLELLEQKLKN